jgi:hypothetical protein
MLMNRFHGTCTKPVLLLSYEGSRPAKARKGSFGIGHHPHDGSAE